jgi:hypothetical protein
MMRGLAILLALAVTPTALADTGSWNFRVLLDGREIGRHSYQLRPDGGALELRSEARFDVRLLFISAYRYRHDAVERWQDGCLRGLESQTVTNGERVAVSARDVGGRLSVERPGATDTHAGCIFSFAYWDPRILDATALLNSQTGELVSVRVERLGSESMTVQGRDLPTSRHRITGTDLQIDLWYADGRWVALEALTEGGRRLRYELMEERTT